MFTLVIGWNVEFSVHVVLVDTAVSVWKDVSTVVETSSPREVSTVVVAVSNTVVRLEAVVVFVIKHSGPQLHAAS